MESTFRLLAIEATRMQPESLKPIQSAFDALPAAVLLADPSGRIAYANPRVCRALSFSAEELQGQPMTLLLGEGFTDETREAIRSTFASGGWAGEMVAASKSGSSLRLAVEISPFTPQGESEPWFLAVGREISSERAFQDRLLREAKLGTLGLIAHNATHTVRNHLAALKMSLYMLEQADDDTDPSVHFNIAREEINRIEFFLRDLEHHANPPPLRLETCRLLDVINLGLEEARPLLAQKSVSLHRQFPPESPVVEVDRMQLARCFTQLVQNAVAAMTRAQELHVVVKRHPAKNKTWWTVEIRDSGKGISPPDRHRVFEPFFTTNGKSLGLGLASVRRVMELHGGEAELLSSSPDGTAVALRIPALEQAGR